MTTPSGEKTALGFVNLNEYVDDIRGDGPMGSNIQEHVTEEN